MKISIFTVIFGLFLAIFSEKVCCDNYRVYSVNAETLEQLKALRYSKNIRAGVLFIEVSNSLQENVDIVVPPHAVEEITTLLEAYEIKNKIKTENSQT